MAQEKHNIDDYFRDRLFEYDPPAPDDMWIRINYSIKKKKKVAIWVTVGSIAATIVVIFSLGVGYYFGSTYTKHQLSSNNKAIKANTYKPLSYVNNQIPKEYSTVKEGKKYSFTKSSNVIVPTIKKETTEKTETIPYIYIKEKTISLSEIKTNVNMLPDIKSNALMIPKEKYANNIGESISLETFAEIPRKHRVEWEVGGKVAPLYTKSSVQSNNYYTSDYVNSIETPSMAYAGRLIVSIRTSRWRFESGIGYMWENQNLSEVSRNLSISKTNAQISGSLDVNDLVRKYGSTYNISKNNNYDAFNEPAINVANNTRTVSTLESKKEANTTYLMANNTKTIVSSNNGTAIKTSMNQTTKYLTLPFIAYYKLINRKTDVSLCGGISTNILIDAKRYINIEDEVYTLGTIETLRKVGYSGIIGINLEIPVINRLYFKLEPSVNCNLNSVEKSYSIKIYPYSFGIYSGISYVF